MIYTRRPTEILRWFLSVQILFAVYFVYRAIQEFGRCFVDIPPLTTEVLSGVSQSNLLLANSHADLVTISGSIRK